MLVCEQCIWNWNILHHSKESTSSLAVSFSDRMLKSCEEMWDYNNSCWVINEASDVVSRIKDVIQQLYNCQNNLELTELNGS